MEWWRIVVAAALVLVIAWLLHVAGVIGRNPYLRLKMHEDMMGNRLPHTLSLEEKQRLLDIRGIAKRGAGRTVLYIAILALGVCLFLLLGGG